ncbi:MAG: TnsA endonuclease N-terminal domain-containing protein, partial [Pyrinomonadaceae bacterium]
MAVRKIRPNYGSVTGLVADDRSARSIAYESSLERDFIKHLIFNRNVLGFEEQPLTIEFTDSASKRRRYTPDLFISYRKDLALTKDWRPLLAEVKYRSDLFRHWPELKPKFRAARAYAKKRSWDFAIMTEPELRTPYLKNITFLLEYRKYPRDEVRSQLLLDALANSNATTAASLLDLISEDATRRATLLPSLWQLIANGEIVIDLDRQITMVSTIWLGKYKERPKCHEQGAVVSAGSSYRKRWQALCYYPHSEFEAILAKDEETGKSAELKLCDVSSPSASFSQKSEAKDLTLIEQKDWASAELWFNRIQPLLITTRTTDMVKTIAQEAGVHPATVYRKIALYEQSGRVSDLTPVKPNGGKGQSRLPPEPE